MAPPLRHELDPLTARGKKVNPEAPPLGLTRQRHHGGGFGGGGDDDDDDMPSLEQDDSSSDDDDDRRGGAGDDENDEQLRAAMEASKYQYKSDEARAAEGARRARHVAVTMTRRVVVKVTSHSAVTAPHSRRVIVTRRPAVSCCRLTHS